MEVDAKGKIDTNDVPVSIGRNSEGNREHYIGSIDEVAIWSVALDEGEIDGSGFCCRASGQVTHKLGCHKRRVLKNA